MGLGYYGFASFIFVLVCIAMLLGKFLYSDIKRQSKMLDEKETKLLRLYQTVEDSMEEFFDQVGEAKNEIKALGTLHLPPAETVIERPAAEPREKNSLFDTPRFKRIFDELVDGEIDLPPPPSPPEASAAQSAAPPSRNDAVLKLWGEGKDKAQIAEELGITRTEVGLILGLKGDGGVNAK